MKLKPETHSALETFPSSLENYTRDVSGHPLIITALGRTLLSKHLVGLLVYRLLLLCFGFLSCIFMLLGTYCGLEPQVLLLSLLYSRGEGRNYFASLMLKLPRSHFSFCHKQVRVEQSPKGHSAGQCVPECPAPFRPQTIPCEGRGKSRWCRTGNLSFMSPRASLLPGDPQLLL